MARRRQIESNRRIARDRRSSRSRKRRVRGSGVEAARVEGQLRSLLAALRAARLEDDPVGVSSAVVGPPRAEPESVPALLRTIAGEFEAVVALNRNLAREMLRLQRIVERREQVAEAIRSRNGRPVIADSSAILLIAQLLEREGAAEVSVSTLAEKMEDRPLLNHRPDRRRLAGHGRMPRRRRQAGPAFVGRRA